MAKEVFNRYEHKYLLSAEICEKVISELRIHMESDSYNAGGKPYTIANIYYDTPDDYLIRSSLAKPVYKEKLRLRSYGVPKSGDAVFLEKGDYGQQLLPPDMRLMEIKTSMAKPLWLTEILSKYKLNKTSFSKYVTEYADSFCRLENVI